METGDLCADTAPTPKSKACHDPGAVNDTCGVTTYLNTPYSNYMSYTGEIDEQNILTLMLKRNYLRCYNVYVIYTVILLTVWQLLKVHY